MPKAKMSFLIVDEDGKPVVGARVTVTFEVLGGNNRATVVGVTNKTGNYVVSHRSTHSSGFGVEKDGYYESKGGQYFDSNEGGKWQPWNPEIKVVMRKIIKPVPMYTRNTKQSKMVIPAVDRAVGFDLIDFDWVAPYGHGRNSDFIFKLKRDFIDNHNFNCTLTINFSHKADGMQEVKNEYLHSILKLPRYAPDAGYLPTITKTFSSVHDPSDKSKNYVFRVRSESIDKKVFKAMYGKIYGDIEFDPKGKATASIMFKYYLNPDYTKNLEYDPKQNLFKNIQSYEGLTNP